MRKNKTHRTGITGNSGNEGIAIVNAFKEAESIASKIGDIFDEGAGRVLSSFKEALTCVQDMVALIQSISDMVSIFDSILSFIPGGSVIGGLLSGGGRASGGPVTSAIPYLVGENGPEIFIPDGNGFIVPPDAGSAFISSQSSFDDNRYTAAATQSTPDITVIVQSEVERSKAVKFFSNHFPAFQSRQNKGNWQ